MIPVEKSLFLFAVILILVFYQLLAFGIRWGVIFKNEIWYGVDIGLLIFLIFIHIFLGLGFWIYH